MNQVDLNSINKATVYTKDDQTFEGPLCPIPYENAVAIWTKENEVIAIPIQNISYYKVHDVKKIKNDP